MTMTPAQLELENATMALSSTKAELRRAAESIRWQMDNLLKRLDQENPNLNSLGEAQTATELNRLCAVYAAQDYTCRVLQHIVKTEVK